MAHSTSARTHQFRVQLTRDGHRRLDETLAAHQRLYNAAVQECRDAWRMARRSITYADRRQLVLPACGWRQKVFQRRSLTPIRWNFPSLCTTDLWIPSPTPPELRKVQLRDVAMSGRQGKETWGFDSNRYG